MVPATRVKLCHQNSSLSKILTGTTGTTGFPPPPPSGYGLHTSKYIEVKISDGKFIESSTEEIKLLFYNVLTTIGMKIS